MNKSARPRLRFAPSPTGHLHLGHAYSALLNQKLAVEIGGDLLLRIENIDQARCTQLLVDEMLEDLAWLGLKWAAKPTLQSENFDAYQDAFTALQERGFLYPSFLSRSEIRKLTSDKSDWPRDPDGAPFYPGEERNWPLEKHQEAIASGKNHSWRLHTEKALQEVDKPLHWIDMDGAQHIASPAKWGDPVIARADTPTSYHLSVVIDDAAQGITHVVRGKDLAEATDLHRLLQHLLGLPSPIYHHHDLIPDDDGRKLSKSNKSTSLRSLRGDGLTPQDIKQRIGLD